MSGRVCEVEMPSRAECSVVVAVDGSPAAPAAARWAARAAAARGAELLVADAAEDATLLAAAVDTARAEAGPALRVTLLGPDPDPAHRRRTRRARLLVVGAPARPAAAPGGPAHPALAAARRCGSVLVVVPEGGHTGGGPVVVGIGAGTHTSAALDFAVQEAARRGAELVAVHAGDPDTHHSDDHERAHRLLSDALIGYGEKYPAVAITRIVAQDEPARLLLRTALGAALIVLGAGPAAPGPLHRDVLAAAATPVALATHP
ncbi:universal stress protein [Nocardia thailandica]|uniref:Universal stress protein n=1 Tax=Nocardia thailandica TaxID=257275 RepID=A0ABW6PU48_9NOCA